MDWTKAKTILIVALLVTNVFLVFTFGFNQGEQKDVNTEKILLSVLANNNITVAVEIPQKHEKMPVLYIEYKAFDEEKINTLLRDKQYQVADEKITKEEFIRISSMFLKDSGLLNQNVALEGVEKQGTRTIVKYRNKIEGVAIEDSFIYLTFEKGKLFSAESYWLEAKNLSTKRMEIITAAEALTIFMSQIENKDEKIQVEAIELVYWLDTSTFDGEELVTDTALPAWKIVYNGKENKHIYAYKQQ